MILGELLNPFFNSRIFGEKLPLIDLQIITTLTYEISILNASDSRQQT